MILMVTLTQQAQTFGSFGAQPDTVTALYYSSVLSTKLYIGAQTQTNVNRAKYYDGTINTMGFTSIYTSGIRKISAIGRLNNGNIFYVDYNSYSTFYNYDGLSWIQSLNTSAFSNDQISSTITDVLGSTNNTICGFSNNTNTQIYDGASLSKYPNVSTGGPQNGLENYNGTVYGGYTTGYLGYYYGGAWTNEPAWNPANAANGKVMKLCAVGSKLYIISQKTGPIRDCVYLLESGIITGPIITSPSYTGTTKYYGTMEEFDGKLYIGGKQLLRYDGTTLDTLVAENEITSGQIYVLEKYDNKLAIGGSFTNLKGNPILDYLAYLTYSTTSISDVKQNIETHVTITGDRFKSDTEWTVYDMSGRTVMTGGPGTYSLTNTGLYIISTKYGSKKYLR